MYGTKFVRHPASITDLCHMDLIITFRQCKYWWIYRISEFSCLLISVSSGDCPVELKEKVHFRWTEEGFRYLGIIITPSTAQLFEANYGKLITEIKNDLARWEILPLTLVSRVEAVRMNILPRLLFLFQSLPVMISGAFLKKLDKNHILILMAK